MATQKQGVTLVLEVLVMAYFVYAIINDLWDASAGVNDSITGATLIKSVLFIVLLAAVVMQIVKSSGLQK